MQKKRTSWGTPKTFETSKQTDKQITSLDAKHLYHIFVCRMFIEYTPLLLYSIYIHMKAIAIE